MAVAQAGVEFLIVLAETDGAAAGAGDGAVVVGPLAYPVWAVARGGDGGDDRLFVGARVSEGGVDFCDERFVDAGVEVLEACGVEGFAGQGGGGGEGGGVHVLGEEFGEEGDVEDGAEVKGCPGAELPDVPPAVLGCCVTYPWCVAGNERYGWIWGCEVGELRRDGLVAGLDMSLRCQASERVAGLGDFEKVRKEVGKFGLIGVLKNLGFGGVLGL